MAFCHVLKTITDNLVDTLKMAEELDIEVEKYPGDILQIHNKNLLPAEIAPGTYFLIHKHLSKTNNL